MRAQNIQDLEVAVQGFPGWGKKGKEGKKEKEEVRSFFKKRRSYR